MRRTLVWSALALLLAGCATTPADPGSAAARPLQVTDMAGQARDLQAELDAGRSVALVFWQTWCESCSHEAPAVAAAARTYGDRIAFVGVVPGKAETVDDGEVREVSRAWGYDAFPQVRDVDMRLTRGYGVEGTPTVIVLGPDGAERYRGHEPPNGWAAFADGPATPQDPACEDGVCPLPAD